jgi:dihydropyrimidinase
MRRELLIRGGTVVFPDIGVLAADVLIRDGRVAAICAPHEFAASGLGVINATGLHVFPGIIDAHIHFGYAEPPNEYATETIHAAKGGVATVLAYLLHNGSYTEVFADRRADCEARAYIDFGFHFCASSEIHLQELELYAREYGVTSLKYFMQYRGEEGRYVGLDGTDDGFMYSLLHKAARVDRLLVVVHPENIEVVQRLRGQFQLEGRNTLRDFCLSKPSFVESENMVRAMYFAEDANTPIYFPHLSCRRGLDDTKWFRQRYPRIILETCPHYLTHTLDSDVGSVGKANPPLRTQDDCDAIWEGLADGSIEVFASDHVPRKRATKDKGIWQASQGFPASGLILPVLLSEGYHKGRLSLQRIAQVLCLNPAKVFGLSKRKGNIFAGADADITLVDLAKTVQVRASELGSYSDYSLYEGWKMKGWPVLTIVRGEIVMKDGEIVGRSGAGRYLSRPL